jgi:hypothetical protein
VIGRSGRYYPGKSLQESFAKEFPPKPLREFHLGQVLGDPPGYIVKIDWLERAYWTVPPGTTAWNDSANWTRHQMSPAGER